MKIDKLIFDANLIPTKNEDILKYIGVLNEYINFITSSKLNWNEDVRKLILNSFSYISQKLELLKNNLYNNIDLIAWISRSLLEMYFILQYCFLSEDNLKDILLYPINELSSIDKAIYEKGKPEKLSAEDEMFRDNLKVVLEKIESAGLKFNKKLTISREIAEKSGLLDYYEVYFQLHSKYVHPTPYLLFGEKKFVYSPEAKNMFRSLSLYFATKIINDTYKFLEVNNAIE